MKAPDGMLLVTGAVVLAGLGFALYCGINLPLSIAFGFAGGSIANLIGASINIAKINKR